MATPHQLETYNLHRQTCVGNGISQSNYFNRQLEGSLVATPGHPFNIEYVEPDPRTQDNPLPAAIPIWCTWQPRRLMSTSEIAGDTKASREWLFRMVGQCPAIDDNGNLLPITDEDFIVDPQGRKFRIENPILSPDNSFWQFEGVRHL